MGTVAVDLSPLLSGASALYRTFPDEPARTVADRLSALASAGAFLDAPALTSPPAPPLPASAFLGPALTAADRLPLTGSIPADPALLPWEEGTKEMPAHFKSRYMFCTLVGPDAPVAAEDFYFGLYLQSPEADYPPHAHAAEEFYIVLSGHAGWEKNRDGHIVLPPGSRIRHAPDQWHAMRTAGDPLLATWAWTGDLSNESYRLMEGA